MNLDAQKVLDVFQKTLDNLAGLLVTLSHPAHISAVEQRIDDVLSLRDCILTPEVLDQWEHEAGRGEWSTRDDDDLTEEF